MKKKLNGIVWGVLLVIVGVLLALDSLNIVGNVDLFFDGWWTVFIIVPCAVGLFTERDKKGNLIGLLVGVGLLLACQDVFDFDLLWKLFVPLLIIVFGGSILIKSFKNNETVKIIKEIKSNETGARSVCAVFGGADVRPENEEFNGAELTAVFGGVDCDLRNAVIEKDCVIEATAIFGGVDILLPKNVNVKTNSNSLFGGVSDKQRQNSEENTITVYINGTAVFGGIEIK
ncbi:MAG: hypothetical protein IJX75_00480 [Clostridia bacterium]|nr:hypothetical protein [Clostridia bacterium]